jgi:excisionase family DNA binding protein
MHPHEYGLTQALYGVDDTCEKLGIGRNAVYALIHSGELVPVKFGRKTMFAAPDLVRVIESRRGTAIRPMQYRAASKAYLPTPDLQDGMLANFLSEVGKTDDYATRRLTKDFDFQDFMQSKPGEK